MIICLLIAILGFAIYAVSSIVTDRLLERRIKDIEEKMNGFVKRLDIPTIEDSTPTKIASLDYKELADKYGATSGSDMVNGLTYDLSRNMDIKVSKTLKNTIMKLVEKRKATGKLAELIKDFNNLPCDEKIRRISETRVEMEKEVWISNACKYLEENLLNYWSQLNANSTNDFIERFKQSMKDKL